MGIVDKAKSLFRGRPVTSEEPTGRAESKIIQEEMLQDRLSQEGSGAVFRSGGRKT